MFVIEISIYGNACMYNSIEEPKTNFDIIAQK